MDNYEESSRNTANAEDAGAAEATRESRDQARALELLRLDAMTVHANAALEGGDLAAVDRLLRISERRAKLLGLDADVRSRVEVRVEAEIKEQLELIFEAVEREFAEEPDIVNRFLRAIATSHAEAEAELAAMLHARGAALPAAPEDDDVTSGDAAGG